MPGYGASLTLDVADGVSLFETTLSGTSTSFVGSYFDQFSYYWNAIWYLAFALWLIWNLLGINGPDRPLYDRGQERLAKKHTLNKMKGKTIDLRKGNRRQYGGSSIDVKSMD